MSYPFYYPVVPISSVESPVSIVANPWDGYNWYQSHPSSDVMAASPCSCGCQTPISQITAGKPNLHYPIEYRPPEPPPLLSLGNSPDITLTSYLSPSHSHLIYSPPQSSNIHTAEFFAPYMYTPSFTLTCHTTLSSGQPYYALELANPITTPTLSQIPERKYVSCDEKVNGDACESVSFKGCGDACVGDRDKLQMESQLKPGVAVVGTVGRNDQADTSKLVKEAVEIHGELIVDAVEVEPQVFDKSLETLKLNLDASNDIRQQSEVSSDLVSEFPQTPTHVSTIVFAAPLMFDESPERVRKVVLLPIATGEVKSGNNVIVASELGVENDGDGAVRESILGGNIFFKGSGDACDEDDGFSLFTEAEESVKEVGSDGGEENTMGYEPWNREWDWDDESDVEIETEVGNGDVSGEDGNEIEGDAPEEFFEVEEIFSSMDTQIGKGDLDTHIAGKDVVRGSKLNDDNDSVVWIEDLETHPFLDCALDDGTPKPNTSDDGFPKPDTSGNFDEVKVDNRVDEIYSTELAHDVSLVTDTMIVNGDDRSAVEAVVSANEELVKLREEVATLLKSSSAAGEDEDVDSTSGLDAAEKLTELYEKLQVMGSDAAEAQAAKILAGLGFTKEMQSRPTRSFSGGWRMRISLARALFVQPTLLLLDEPTNHLDLRAVLWLEEYLCRWKKTLVVVSHDRDFLNTVCDEIIHLHDLQLHFYRGNYDEFETGYEQRRKETNKKYDNHEKQMKAAMKTGNRVAQEKVKNRAKLAAAKEASKNKSKGKVDEDEPVPDAPRRWRDYTVEFHFPEPTELTPPLMQLIEVSFSYPNREDFRLCNVDVGIDMGTRVAIVGPNGAGKSTLLNLLAGDLVPSEGEVRRSQKLRVGRYSQHFVDLLTMEETPVQYLLRLHPDQEGLSKQEAVRAKLGKFGLPSHNHLSPIAKLSGGQKARVVFTSISMSKPHILLLDEPTNHLDMQSIDALADALDEFSGGVVLVSHDSRLISRVCEDEEKSEIWVVENGTVEKFPGTFDEYKEELQQEIREEVDD